MNTRKSKVNIYLLLAGMIILFFSLKVRISAKNMDLIKVKIELSNNIQSISGSKSTVDYRFWSNDRHNQFEILSGSVSAGKHKPISKLRKGQTVELDISRSDFLHMADKGTVIIVRGIKSGGIYLMSPEEFSHNRNLYKLRIEIIAFFTGCMFIINGITTVSNKINYILTGLFAGCLVVMRIFEFGLY